MGSLIPVVVIVKDAKPAKRARKRIASPSNDIRELALAPASHSWKRSAARRATNKYNANAQLAEH
jgi:hypothetical protein